VFEVIVVVISFSKAVVSATVSTFVVRSTECVVTSKGDSVVTVITGIVGVSSVLEVILFEIVVDVISLVLCRLTVVRFGSTVTSSY
jgi:hypothetical protein